MRRAALALAAAAALAGCPEDRGHGRQRVPAARVPAAMAVEPTLPPMPLPPAAPEDPPPGAPTTSGR
ncbi:MAG: hypothetical protein HZB56_09800 [Deltaproteobacteria bacterium]|nr:hypothetical protein [Deltaproteobacteria bacterium]